MKNGYTVNCYNSSGKRVKIYQCKTLEDAKKIREKWIAENKTDLYHQPTIFHGAIRESGY